MAEYIRLTKKSTCIAKATPKSESEIYWKLYKNTKKYCLKETVASINFCHLDSVLCDESSLPTCDLVVASGRNVTLYDSSNFLPYKRYSRFENDVLSAVIRKDSKLIAASGKDCKINVYETCTRDILRVFTGHTKQINTVSFDDKKLTSVVSFSSDGSIRVWDLPSNILLQNIENAHSPEVLFGVQNPFDFNLWVSSGSDALVKHWDFRDFKKPAVEMKTTLPAEKIRFVNENLLFVSKKNIISALDMRMGGKTLKTLEIFSKTVTGLDYDERRNELLACSLDASVKMINATDFTVCFERRFTAPLTAISIDSKKGRMAVGDSKGDLKLLRINEKSSFWNKLIKPAKFGGKRANNTENGIYSYENGDFVTVETNAKFPKLALYDKHMKSFKYKSALDSVISNNGATGDLVAAIFKELMDRQALNIALNDRDDETLLPVLKAINRHFIRPGATEFVFVNVVWAILELYDNDAFDWEKCGPELIMLKRKVVAQLKLQTDLNDFIGVIDTITELTN